MRFSLCLSALGVAALLAGCTQPPPNDTRNSVGFGDYDEFLTEQQAREAALASGNSMVLPSGADAPLTDISDGGEAVATAVTENAEAAPDPSLLLRGPGISDENSFDAVSERVSIEDDQQRLAAQRELFEVIEPTDLPDRPSGDLASVVQFALSTSHSVGQVVYPRGVFAGSGRACNRYSNANEAQQVFLRNGGPERDPRGLDPDGDGYACLWDPTPFRMAVRN